MRHISPWKINAALAILVAGLVAFAFVVEVQPSGDGAPAVQHVTAPAADPIGLLRASYPESPYP